jgi:DNA-binding NtrC family response regulator
MEERAQAVWREGKGDASGGNEAWRTGPAFSRNQADSGRRRRDGGGGARSRCFRVWWGMAGVNPPAPACDTRRPSPDEEHDGMNPRTALFIANDHSSLPAIADALADLSCTIRCAGTGDDGLALYETIGPDLVLLDIDVPGASGGVCVLEALAGSGATVLVMSAVAEVDVAVQAMQLGARDFFAKPVDVARLRRSVEQAVGRRERLRALEREPESPECSGCGTLGSSSRMLQLAHQVELAARCPGTSVLLLGESGTGKSHIARLLHSRSPRARSEFVEVNCGGLSPTFLHSELFGHEKGAFTDAKDMKRGLFEVAHRGTLFLDEIGDLAPELQPKLLKVLEKGRFRRLGGTREIEVDVRIVAATNSDLRAAVRDGRFRNDLFYRLCVFPLHIPPVRERAEEDVVQLLRWSLRDLRRRYPDSPARLAPKAMDLLIGYAWPGNVRELRNVLEFALVLAHGAEWIEARHLPADLRGERAQRAPARGWEDMTLEEVERRHVERTLYHTRGNRTLAATKLGISRATLHAKIKTYGLTDAGRVAPRPRG